ncbi:hypothetical protein V1477_009682 [Vespula maculifrons]|uniref:Uncharacterized protein n=1 Tax=Vespula maculifrons TaxID=7453 RepID=A0ABD2CCP4_VESMC
MDSANLYNACSLVYARNSCSVSESDDDNDDDDDEDDDKDDKDDNDDNDDDDDDNDDDDDDEEDESSNRQIEGIVYKTDISKKEISAV